MGVLDSIFIFHSKIPEKNVYYLWVAGETLPFIIKSHEKIFSVKNKQKCYLFKLYFLCFNLGRGGGKKRCLYKST